MNAGKEIVSSSDVANEDSSLNSGDHVQRGKWERIQEIIWDGPRPEEEKKLVQRLDLFLMYGQRLSFPFVSGSTSY
jgi:ACS family pantothenate transporter-like MFS transporter